MADDVRLTDLELIRRFSIAVRGESATREELVEVLRADLTWLEGGRRAAARSATPEVVRAEPAAPARAQQPVKPAPVRKPAPAAKAVATKPAAAKAVARKAAAAKPVARKPAAKKVAVKKAAAKKTGRR